MSAAYRRRPRRTFATATSRCAMPPRSRTSARLARCSSARPTCTSSRSAQRTRIPPLASPATRTIRRDRPAARAADRRRASPQGWRSPPSAPIPAGRVAPPPPHTASSADPGGQFRPPAAAGGIGGLNPSFGEVSTEGVGPLSGPLDPVGPLTLTVAAASLVSHALLGDEPVAPPVPLPLHAVRLAIP